MHAVVIIDAELHWIERPDPVAGDTELLVAVRAAGLNGADLVQRKGFYPAPPGSPPDIPGLEFAGEVVAIGRQVRRFAVGDRVMAVVGGGGQATMTVVDESHALAVPDTISWAEAGGFPEAFSTAFDALWRQGELTVGERVLVTGAAGGVGSAGVQLAAATGAEVIAAVRDHALWDAVAQLGAAEVIDPDAIGAHGPYDVILELVGAPSLSAALGALALNARIVVIGMGGGSRIDLNLFDLMASRARISGSMLRSRDRTDKATVAAGVASHVLPLLERGRITVPVCATVPMSEPVAAYDRFAAGSKLGKVVLTV